MSQCMENKSFYLLNFKLKPFVWQYNQAWIWMMDKKKGILQINELDEIRQDALQRTMLIQNKRNKWHDKFIKQKKFNTGDWALLFDSQFKNFKGNLTTRWVAPYEVVTTFGNGFDQ